VANTALEPSAPMKLNAPRLSADVSQTMKSNSTTLADEGFLSDEASDVVVVVRERYAAHFVEVRAINRLLTRSQYGLTIHPQSAQEMTCAALFVRSIAHCQAAVLLLERGMVASGRAVIRCALEGLFNLGACANDRNVALSFVDADQVDRKRRAKYLAQVQDPSARTRLEDADLAEILQQIQVKIDEVEARELRTRDMAKIAGLEDLYLTAYAMLSGSVHSTVGDIDQHFRIDADSKRVDLLTWPVVDGIEGPILMLAETMVGLVRMMTKVCVLDVASECEEHRSRLQRLYVAG
jgi:hypothetical protein